MFHIVLFEPEIPPNTGNIIRLCANTGAHLHLIHPLGFELDEKKLRRAGLDYHEWAKIKEYDKLSEYTETVDPDRIFAVSTRGNTHYSEIKYQAGDSFIFGPETRGLPEDYLKSLDNNHVLRIPMLDSSRSLNLSNAASVVLYEAWRQIGFISQC